MDNISELFARLQTRTIDSEKVKEIIASIHSYYKKWGKVSDRQKELLVKWDAQFSDESKKAAQNWQSEWNEEKKQIFIKVVGYYKKNPPYFGNIVELVEKNPEYIPTQNTYEKMIGNKFVQSFLTKISTAPTFQTGDVVKLLEKGITEGYKVKTYQESYKAILSNPVKHICTVISVEESPKGWVYTLRTLEGGILKVNQTGISKKTVKDKN